MRKLLAATILSLATLTVAPVPIFADEPPATTQPTTAVPVKSVVLFSSGVGYFEHRGVVHADTAAELHFKTEQINDILKSLVLKDLDGGKISIVSYPSQDPVEKTLKSFQVDLDEQSEPGGFAQISSAEQKYPCKPPTPSPAPSSALRNSSAPSAIKPRSKKAC